MRRLFTAEEARQTGLTREGLRWGVRAGRWRPVGRGVFVVGADEPTPLEREVAAVMPAAALPVAPPRVCCSSSTAWVCEDQTSRFRRRAADAGPECDDERFRRIG